MFSSFPKHKCYKGRVIIIWTNLLELPAKNHCRIFFLQSNSSVTHNLCWKTAMIFILYVVHLLFSYRYITFFAFTAVILLHVPLFTYMFLCWFYHTMPYNWVLLLQHKASTAREFSSNQLPNWLLSSATNVSSDTFTSETCWCQQLCYQITWYLPSLQLSFPCKFLITHLYSIYITQ